VGLISEFKTFAMRGNVLDMAVGVIIGGAFGKVVSSFVSDVLMPPIGMLLGGVDFTSFKLMLKEPAGQTPAVTLNYGSFIQNIVDFLIVAFAIFLLIRAVNAMQRKPAPAPAAPPPPPPEEVVLLREIRDTLRSR
jgi:large conductance mechanosensitive channel